MLMPVSPGPVVLATRDARLASAVAMVLEGLHDAALRLTTVDNVPDCCVAIRLLHPCVVLFDDGVGEAPGTECLNLVQSVESGVPVIYVASNHSLDLEREVRRQGVLFYIARPEEVEVLQSSLTSILRSLVRRTG